jgi:hypothetical protein
MSPNRAEPRWTSTASRLQNQYEAYTNHPRVATPTCVRLQTRGNLHPSCPTARYKRVGGSQMSAYLREHGGCIGQGSLGEACARVGKPGARGSQGVHSRREDMHHHRQRLKGWHGAVRGQGDRAQVCESESSLAPSPQKEA